MYNRPTYPMMRSSNQYRHDQRMFPVLPFIAGLAVSPLLFGGGRPVYAPNFGPNYGPSFGPNFGYQARPPYQHPYYHF